MDRPWEQNVTETTRTQALGLFREGNALFTDAEYAQAAQRYRQALKLWDHPRIHGNLATALIYLDEPVEAMKELELALAYGKAPFEPQIYAQLMTNRKLLLGQLTRIRVTCKLAGSAVTVDGKPLFVGPGSREVLVVAGAHQVVAKKAHHLTQSKSMYTSGGSLEQVLLTPIPLADMSRRERRWSVWKPWAVVGGGAAVALLGIPLGRASIHARSQFENQLRDTCPSGCTDAQLAAAQHYEDRARLWNRLEVTAYTVGAAALIAGGVLAYLNREHEIEFDEQGRRLAAVPYVGRAAIGLTLELGF